MYVIKHQLAYLTTQFLEGKVQKLQNLCFNCSKLKQNKHVPISLKTIHTCKFIQIFNYAMQITLHVTKKYLVLTN